MSIYSRWNVEPIINATGTVTRLGGKPLSENVRRVMSEAARESVSLEHLHSAASRRTAEITGTEAALVTSGASAALTLGAAAILARYNPGVMDSLPDGHGPRREFLVARDQRNGYDHAVRLTGARLREVGLNETTSGAGVRGVEAWEFAAAIDPARTVGILVVLRDEVRPRLEEIVAVARNHCLPVLVDAAAELPPRENLRAIPASGASLVCFSGGKVIGGPQATGILCGGAELVASAALQMLDMDDHPELWDPPPDWIDRTRLLGMPRQGLGRGFKVSKEQIVGLLVALDEFLERDLVAEAAAQRKWLAALADALSGARCKCHLPPSYHAEVPPLLAIHVEPASRRTAFDVCRRLREGTPPVYVGHARLAEGMLIVNASCLQEAQLEALTTALQTVLA